VLHANNHFPLPKNNEPQITTTGFSMANSKNSSFKYHAFISYRHADNKTQGRKWATWLHQAIETYEVPNDLVGQKNSRGDTIPPRIYPVFRDEIQLCHPS
jgi:hypothetical protein